MTGDLKHWILSNNQFKTPFSLDLGTNGHSNFKSFLEKPPDKCQRTHIIQNSFHGMSFVSFFHFSKRRGRHLVENSTFFVFFI